MSKLVNGSVKPSDPVANTALDRHISLNNNDKLKKLQCSLDSEGYAIVLSNNKSKQKNVFYNQIFILI